MGNEVRRMEDLRQRLADANAELNVQEKRKKAILEALKKLGIKNLSDLPKAIGKQRKLQKTLKKKLDKSLETLENEFKNLHA